MIIEKENVYNSLCLKDVPVGTPVDNNGTTIMRVIATENLKGIEKEGYCLIVVLATGRLCQLSDALVVNKVEHKLMVTVCH